jgi:hypothetical protein
MNNLFNDSVISMTSPTAVLGGGNHALQAERRDNGDVHLYVVDILSGWASGIQLQAAGFDTAYASMSNMSRQAIQEESTVRLRAMSKTRDLTSGDEMLRCFCSAAASIKSGSAYQAILSERASVAGHWFYVGYTLYDGSYVVQPAYMPPHSSPASDNLFARDVSRIVDGHLALLNSGGSAIGRTLRKGGGPILPILIG